MTLRGSDCVNVEALSSTNIMDVIEDALSSEDELLHVYIFFLTGTRAGSKPLIIHIKS
jgi:hypothetical protein